jgi:hypothetical protein
MQIFWFLPEELSDGERQGALRAMDRLQPLGESFVVDGVFDPAPLKPESLAIVTWDTYRELRLTKSIEDQVWGSVQGRVSPGEPCLKEHIQLLDLDVVGPQDLKQLVGVPVFEKAWTLPDRDLDTWLQHLEKDLAKAQWHGREEWLRGLLLGAKRGALPQTPIECHVGRDWLQIRFFSSILPVWPSQTQKGAFEQLLFYFADCVECRTLVQDKPLCYEWRASLWRQPVGALKPDSLRSLRIKKERVHSLQDRFSALKPLEIGRVLPLRQTTPEPIDLERYQSRYFEVKRDLEDLARKLIKLERDSNGEPTQVSALLQEMEALNHQLRKWVGALLKEVSRGKRRASTPS